MSETVALHHTVEGPPDAPVLVLGTSIGTSSAMWDPQVADLARHYRVVRYDHRGHGSSPVPSGPYSLDDLGGDVLALLDRLGVERAAVGGLSLGGMVAMWLAINAPERVSSLVLCCTSAYLGPPDRWEERAVLVRREGTGALAEAMTPRWFSERTRADAPDVVERLVKDLVGTPAEGYAGCCAAIGGMDLRDQIGAIRAPTLILCGSDDPATPLEMALVLNEAIEGSQLVMLPAAAHLATAEQPERATAAILAHLQGSVGDGRGGAPGMGQGMATRRSVLGDDHVDAAIEATTPLTAEFQDLITRYAWGEIWSRPGLDRPTRSALTLAMLVALRQHDELALHLRAARRNGLSWEQIGEVLLQAAIYCGVPAANSAFAVASRVQAEEG